MQPTALMNGDEIKIRLAVCKAVMNVSVMDAGFRRANAMGCHLGPNLAAFVGSA